MRLWALHRSFSQVLGRARGLRRIRTAVRRRGRPLEGGLQHARRHVGRRPRGRLQRDLEGSVHGHREEPLRPRVRRRPSRRPDGDAGAGGLGPGRAHRGQSPQRRPGIWAIPDLAYWFNGELRVLAASESTPSWSDHASCASVASCPRRPNNESPRTCPSETMRTFVERATSTSLPSKSWSSWGWPTAKPGFHSKCSGP